MRSSANNISLSLCAVTAVFCLSSCVIDSGDNTRSEYRMQNATTAFFYRYVQSPLEYLRTGITLDKYLSLTEEERASSDYAFLKESYEAHGDVQTLLGYSYTTGGSSIWDNGAVWGSDLGMTISKAETDSTWILGVTGDHLESCSLEVRMTGPMSFSWAEFVVNGRGDYSSGDLEAHFSEKDFVYKWFRKVNYSYVEMYDSFKGTFEVLFYDGPLQMDWSRLTFDGLSGFSSFTSSWGGGLPRE